MKIKLLLPCYCGMYDLEFPVEVEASRRGSMYMVHEKELKRIGCDMSIICDPEDPLWPFAGNEVEVIS